MAANGSSALGATNVVYVALPPGAIPNADEVRIRVRSSGSSVNARAVDGGLDPVTLNATSVQLQSGATPVTGALAFIDEAHLTATVVPNATLAAATDYTVTVTQGIPGASCGLTAGGTGYCWGANASGQLGIGSTGPEICGFARDYDDCSKVPVAISGGLRFRQLAIGGYIGQAHACGVTETGDVYCWGNNDAGQLGDGTTASKRSPVRIANPR